jgi:hypothetical protein
MIAPVPANCDFENNASLDTPTIVKDVMLGDAQGMSKLKESLKR